MTKGRLVVLNALRELDACDMWHLRLRRITTLSALRAKVLAVPELREHAFIRLRKRGYRPPKWRPTWRVCHFGWKECSCFSDADAKIYIRAIRISHFRKWLEKRVHRSFWLTRRASMNY